MSPSFASGETDFAKQEANADSRYPSNFWVSVIVLLHLKNSVGDAFLL